MSRDKNLNQAILEYSNGNFSASEDIINAIWDEEKGNSKIWNLKSAIASKKGNHVESINILIDAKKKFHPNESICLNLALSYRNIYNFDQSIKFYKEALQINEESTNTIFELTKTYVLKEDFMSALEVLDNLSLKNKNTKELNYYYGYIYERLGNLEKAKKFLTKELRSSPEHIPSLYVLGTVNERSGNYESALENYKKSNSLSKSKIGTNAIANLLLRQKKYDEALSFIENSSKFYSESIQGLTTKAAILSGQKKNIDSACVLLEVIEICESKTEKEKIVEDKNIHLAKTNFLRNFESMTRSGELSRRFKSDKALIQKLVSAFILILDQNENYCHLVEGSLQAHSVNSLSTYKELNEENIQNFSRNEVFLLYVRNVLILNLDIEKFLINFRSHIIKLIANKNFSLFQDKNVINAIGSIALACDTNEYIWEMSEEDKESLRTIQNHLTEKDNYFEISLISLLTFDKIHNFNFSKKINFNKMNFKNKYLTRIKEAQIDIPQKEHSISKKIKSFGKINNPITKLVRKQYEENPYPRWKDINLKTEDNYNLTINNDLHPYKIDNITFDKSSKILIAGCGSGYHALQVAIKGQHSSITAIDISLKNLSYAKRKADELNVKNINFLHADILELENYQESFECIESIGVLHHMQNPYEGFCVLKNLLKKNGIMKIGLYSKLYKNQLEEIRSFIKENGYTRTIEDVREIRRYIKQSKDQAFVKARETIRDFYLTSEFVDLLIHEQEHFFTIDDLKKWINNDFNFLGFVFPIASQDFIKPEYIKQFPEDIYCQNLDNWDLFEKENPDTFKSMYNMYLQKI